MRKKCKAYRRNDQLICDRCGLIWDVNDTDPPKCFDIASNELAKIKEMLNAKKIATKTPHQG